MNAAFKSFTGITIADAAIGAGFLILMGYAGAALGGWMWGTMP